MKRAYLVFETENAKVPTESWLETGQRPTSPWLSQQTYSGHDHIWDSLYSETSHLPLTLCYSQFLNKAPGLSATSLLPGMPCPVETYECHHALSKNRLPPPATGSRDHDY